MELSLTISKLLGYVVIIWAIFMKIPQLRDIIKAKSGVGVSLKSYVLELFIYAITFSYHIRNNYALTTYFDFFFLIIQDILISLAIVYYAKQFNKKFILISSMFISVFIFLLTICPVPIIFIENLILSFLSLLNSFGIPFNIISKLPQIIENYKNKFTGTLSLSLNVSLFIANTFRIYTTLIEMKGDSTMLLSYIVAISLNLTVVIQILLYRKNKPHDDKIENDDFSV